MRVSFRLHDERDGDIIEVLKNTKNLSEEIRRLIRLGLRNMATEHQTGFAPLNAEERVPVSYVTKI